MDWIEETDYITFISSLFALYHETFSEAEYIPVNVIITEDLNKTHAEIRQDLAKTILAENIQSDFNGRMVVPDSVDENIFILLNQTKVIEYTNNGSFTWIGTVAHEYTHAIDFYQMARMEKLTSYTPLEDASLYLMFQLWTEYHARKIGYRFLRKWFEDTGKLLQGKEQVLYILNTEARYQTKRFEQEYTKGTPNEKLYFTMQYLGRYSVWIDLFPDYFDVDKLLDWCPEAYWMRDLLQFLRSHESLESIYGCFNELEDILSEIGLSN